MWSRTLWTFCVAIVISGCADDTPEGPTAEDAYVDFVAAFEAFKVTHCDCYTDSIYSGDRLVCEDSFAEQPPVDDCRREVFEAWPESSRSFVECGAEASRVYHACIEQCPEVHEEQACSLSLSANWFTCGSNVPAAMLDELRACSAPAMMMP